MPSERERCREAEREIRRKRVLYYRLRQKFQGNFENLKKLNLSENRFSDWRQIWRLGWLPSLESLLINHNELESVEYLGEEFLRRKGAEAATYRVVYDDDVLKSKESAESQKDEEKNTQSVTENTGTASANHGSKPQDFQEYILKQKKNL